MKEQQVIYYTDELNEEFSTFKTTPRAIDASYDYDDSSFGKKVRRFFCYRIVMYPFAYLYTKLVFRRKVVGADLLKPYRKQGIFLFGNHTQPMGDALMQACLTYPRLNYVIIHPNNLNVPVFGKMVPALGGLPIPDGVSAYRNFRNAIENRIRRGNPVVIYPEAHIWPYYTHIRPFAETSFAYPVQMKAPTFCFVNTYKDRGKGRRPQIVTYIKGPFFPDENLTAKEQRKQLRNLVYDQMVQLSQHSDVEYVKYIKKETDKGDSNG